MSGRRRKSTGTKKTTSGPDNVKTTLGSTSEEDVDSSVETTKPRKQVKFEDTEKVEVTKVPETQASVSEKPKLDDPETKEQEKEESKPVGKLESLLRAGSTSKSGSKKEDSFDLAGDKGFSCTGMLTKNLYISSDEGHQSGVASGENVKPDLSNLASDEKTSASEVKGEKDVGQKSKKLPKGPRKPSIFDVDDVSTSSSSSDNRSNDTDSSSSSFKLDLDE